MQYTELIEKAGSNFSAHVPDLPGCVVTGAPRAEVESLLREAIEVSGHPEDRDGN